jgi:cytochrome c oxidase subunit II
VFMSRQCMMCHTIEGTNARAALGPDLTHFASRKFLGAGVASNTRAKLLTWIYDPQHDKPGNRMPANHLEKADLEALVDYLETLK